MTGEGNGNPLQYFCLENPVDREAWWAAVHRVAQSQMRLNRLSMHACMQAVDGQAESMDYTHGRSILSAALQSQALPTRPHLGVRPKTGSQTLPAQSCCPSFSLHRHVLCQHLSLLIPFTCSLEMPVVLIPQVFCPRNVLSSLPPSHHPSLSHYVLIDLCMFVSEWSWE